MTWQIFVLGSVFLYSVTVLLQRVMLKEDIDPLSLATLFQLLTGILIGAYGLASGEMNFPHLDGIALPFALVIILYTIGNVLVFYALKHMEASTFTVIFSSRALVTVLAAWVVLSEHLSFGQWLGALLIIVGVVLVHNKKLNLAELYALPAAFCFGLANLLDRIMLATFEVVPYLFLSFILPGILLFLVVRKLPRVSSRMVLLCVLYAVQAIFFMIALKVAPTASQVVTVNMIQVVLTVVLAMIFLGERDNITLTALGAIISFIGAIMLV